MDKTKEELLEIILGLKENIRYESDMFDALKDDILQYGIYVYYNDDHSLRTIQKPNKVNIKETE